MGNKIRAVQDELDDSCFLGIGQWLGVFLKDSSTTSFLDLGHGMHHEAGFLGLREIE